MCLPAALQLNYEHCFASTLITVIVLILLIVGVISISQSPNQNKLTKGLLAVAKNTRWKMWREQKESIKKFRA